MIDPKLIREQPDLIRASQRARGIDESTVDAVVAADERRRATIARYDALRNEQKSLGKEVAKATGDERAALLARSKELSDAVKAAEAEQVAAADAYRELHLAIPNIVADGRSARRRGRLRRARARRDASGLHRRGLRAA